MAFTKITPEELRDKGVIGLPDAPELNTTEMQEKFDEIALDVIVPKFNNLIDELEGAFETTDGAISDESDRAQKAEGELSDAIYALDAEVMKIAVYDTDEDGVVDNAKQLDGHPASYFLSSAVLSDYYTKTETNTALAGKVDKVQGKGLSTNDYSDADKTVVSGVTSALSGKVDKEAGKGLSSNDFTTSYKDQIGTNATNIGDLTDLTTTAKNNLVEAINEAAQGGGGGASDLDDLNDVNLTNPTDGQVLKYNATSSKWENGAGGGGGASTLSDLTDTAIDTPSAGQLLQYDSNGKWANTTPSFGDMKAADYAKNAFPNVVERSMAAQLLTGNYDELVLVGHESIYKYETSFNYNFVFPGNSYSLSDTLVCLTNSVVNTEYSLVDMSGYDVKYTNTNDEEITISTSSIEPEYIISQPVPSDCDVTKPITFIAYGLPGPVTGLDMLKYKCSSSSLNMDDQHTEVKFFMKSDGTLGYYDFYNREFKTTGSGGGGGNPILPINPTDPTYKSTPGAIWIET